MCGSAETTQKSKRSRRDTDLQSGKSVPTKQLRRVSGAEVRKRNCVGTAYEKQLRRVSGAEEAKNHA